MGLKDLKYAPRRTTLRLIFDEAVRAELDAAKAAYVAAKRRSDGVLSSDSEANQRLEKAAETAEASAVSFVFEAIPRSRMAELVAACPPTSEQLEKWKERDRNSPLISIPAPEFDYDKFAPRLIAASLVEPETSEEEMVELWEEGGWSDAIWEALWVAAWDKTNQEVTSLPTSGTGFDMTPNSAPELVTP